MGVATHLRMFTAVVLPDGSAVCSEGARLSSIQFSGPAILAGTEF